MKKNRRLGSHSLIKIRFLLAFFFILYLLMKINFKQWWLTIPSISTKQTTTSHLNWLKKKPGLGQAQKYGRVKPVNGFPTFPFWRCHWLVNSKGQSEMNPYVALLDVCVYRQTNEYKKDPTNISEILTTRLVESLTHHLSSWLTTWVLDSPLVYGTHHFVHKIIKNVLVELVTYFW